MIEMTIVTKGLAWELVVLTLAYLEVQIEGENSWAGALPCWRRFVKYFPKEITGYHIGLVAFSLTFMFAILIIFETEINLNITLYSLSLLVMLALFEDFTWNVINPSKEYGVIKLKEKYPAFKDISVAVLHCFAIFFSFMLAFLAGMKEEWLAIIAILIVATIAITVARYKIDLINRMRI